MTDAEARAILTTYGAPVNIATHIEAKANSAGFSTRSGDGW